MAEEKTVVVTQDRFGRDVIVPIDENGNIILYRATDDPYRIIDSDFKNIKGDSGTVGLGQQSYFSPNPMYSHTYEGLGRKNYKFKTSIKPNEILVMTKKIKDFPELVKALNIPEEFTNMSWWRFMMDDRAQVAMGYEMGTKRFFNENIQVFKDNGIKALSYSSGTGGKSYIEWEIIPLIKDGDTLDIKPVAILEVEEGLAGKTLDAFTEISLDTPTNVVGAEVIDEAVDITESSGSIVNEIEGIQGETIEKLRNANDAFVAEQVDDIMARKINEVLPFVDTSLSRAEAIGISTTGPQITTSADPVLNTFIDDIEKITGQTLDITEKRKLRQFMYDAATNNEYGLLNDAKSFIPDLRDSVNSSKLNDPGYKVWKNWQNSGAFREKNITGMTPNEFTAFGPPDYVYLVEGLEKSGENINFTAISDAGVNIPEGIDTPTNVVDDVTVGGVREERFFSGFGGNIDIPLQINQQGNVILYRTTDNPNYLQVSDFVQKNTSDIGSLGFGQHSYFGPNIETPQAFWVASSDRGLYKYDTNIKPSEIFIGKIGDKPELAKALGIPEQYWNMNYHRFLIETKDTYRKVLTDNIELFKQYGIKALGRYGGTSGPKSFEIIPLITNEDSLGVRAVAELEPIKGIGKGGADNWKVKEVLTDTPGASLGAAKLNDPVVFDSWVDNLGRTTTSFVDNLPLETVVKNRVKNLVARKSAQLSTPSGLIDAVDAWELLVLGLMVAAVAYSEIEEVPTLVKNSQINMFNNMTSSYDIPPVQPEQYDLDYEFITKVLDTGENYMPTDIIIKKVGEESKKTYITYGDFETKKENVDPQETARILKDIATSPASYYRPTSNREAIESMNNQQTTDTMEKTQIIQPGVQEEKMFEQAKPQKGSGAGSGVKIL